MKVQRQFCRKCVQSTVPAVTLTFDNGARRLHWCAKDVDDAMAYRPTADRSPLSVAEAEYKMNSRYLVWSATMDTYVRVVEVSSDGDEWWARVRFTDPDTSRGVTRIVGIDDLYPKAPEGETAIRVQHTDGSVGALLTDLDGVYASPEAGIPVRWRTGAQTGEAMVPINDLTMVWSIYSPSFKTDVPHGTF